MKFLLCLLFSMAGIYLAGLFFPWWSLAPVCFLATLLLGLGRGTAFLSGFLSAGLLWFTLAWMRNLANDSILADRISELFFGRSNPYLLMGMSALVAAWLGGLSALAGSLLHLRHRPRLQSMGDFLRNRDR